MQLLDYNPVCMAAIYTQMKYISKDNTIDKHTVKHMVFDSIRRLNKLHTKKYGKMVICFDSSSNWRKKEFELYKANRKQKRDEQSDEINWDLFWEALNETKQAVIDNLPYLTVEVVGTEADDVIATIAKYLHETNPMTKTLVLSTDGDFKQLQKYHTVEQYTPVQDKFIKTSDPRVEMLTKIVKGDKKDGVPNIKSDDRSIIDKIRQKSISAKFLKTLIESDEAELPELLSSVELEKFHRNKKLIDLSLSPGELQMEIIKTFEKNEIKGSFLKLMKFLSENELDLLSSKIEDFKSLK